MKYLIIAGLVALGLLAVAEAFFFGGIENFSLNRGLIIGGAVYFFLTMEGYKREMREMREFIRAEVAKVPEIVRTNSEYRHETIMRRLVQIENKLDALSGERR
jgi:hypothetical protein